ncbi:hypothetical protein TUM4636_32130 [Shewanella glacialipiscicola]|nr:hypothetical protein TUM4636_32130 [Shewanella glacialipiscicola]
MPKCDIARGVTISDRSLNRMPVLIEGAAGLNVMFYNINIQNLHAERYV